MGLSKKRSKLIKTWLIRFCSFFVILYPLIMLHCIYGLDISAISVSFENTKHILNRLHNFCDICTSNCYTSYLEENMPESLMHIPAKLKTHIYISKTKCFVKNIIVLILSVKMCTMLSWSKFEEATDIFSSVGCLFYKVPKQVTQDWVLRLGYSTR